MGMDMVSKHWSNPLGHFEDSAFVELNDAILRHAGGRWDDPPSEEAILAQAVGFSEAIQQAIKERNQGVWGWKDPRTSLTIPTIASHLDHVQYIICRRAPDAIAASLYRRNRMPIAQGLQLGDIYARRIQSFFRENAELDSLDVSYEDILAEPEQQLERMCRFLGLMVTSEMKRSALERILPAEKLRLLSRKQRWRDRLRRIRKFAREPWRAPEHLWKKIQRRSAKKQG